MQVKQAIMDTFQSNEWKHDAMFNSLRKSKDAIISKDIAFDILDRPGRFWFEVNHVIEVYNKTHFRYFAAYYLSISFKNDIIY